MGENTEKPSISRGDFIKWLGAVGAGAALGKILTSERKPNSPPSSAQKTAVVIEKTLDAFKEQLQSLPKDILLKTFKLLVKDNSLSQGTAFAFFQREVEASDGVKKNVTMFLTARHVINQYASSLDFTQPHLQEFNLDKRFCFSDDPNSNAKTDFYVYPGVSDFAIIMQVGDKPLFKEGNFSTPLGTSPLSEKTSVVTLGYPEFDDIEIGQKGFVSSGLIKDFDPQSNAYGITGAATDLGVSGSPWWDIKRDCVVGVTSKGNRYNNFSTMTPITEESLFRIIDKRGDNNGSSKSLGDTLLEYGINVDSKIKPFFNLIK